MKKLIFCLAAAMLSLSMFTSCAPKHGTTLAVNPLTYTDIPDNDVIRVDDNYYMVSTTMYFCPGAPIMKSKDLVHWQIVNYIYDTLADDDVYNLRNGKNAYGKGQWATSLRYHEGTYYALFIANDQPGKTFVYKTDDIENGKWEQTIINRSFHDASLLFDDDRLFLLWGNGNLRLTELEPDASGIKEGGIDQVIIEAPREGYGLAAEGVHFYHIGEYYYVLEISWPINGIRTETCWRSRDILGPYESKVVLQGPIGGRDADGVAQGALLDTQFGDWYAIMFQDHGAVGRIPTVQPVTWVDGWPIMGDNGVPMEEVLVNLTPSGEDYVWDNDEFDSTELALVWQWNHKPVDDKWSLIERPGWMRLKTCTLANNISEARNSLTQRTVGPCSSSEVILDASGLTPGDRAGICAFQSNNCSIGVEVDESGNKHLVVRENRPGSSRGMRNGRPYIERFIQDEVKYSEPLESEKVWLKIDYVFTPAAGDMSDPDTATVAWSYDGQTWKTCDYTLQMLYTLDYFTGYRTMLYCYPTIAEGGYADFDYFHQYVN